MIVTVDGRIVNSGRPVDIGVQTDNLVTTLEFVGIPEYSPGQLVVIYVSTSTGYADATLLKDDSGHYTYDIQRDLTEHKLEHIDAYLEVTSGIVVWHSNVFELRLARIPDSAEYVPDQDSGLLEQILGQVSAYTTAAAQAAETANRAAASAIAASGDLGHMTGVVATRETDLEVVSGLLSATTGARASSPNVNRAYTLLDVKGDTLIIFFPAESPYEFRALYYQGVGELPSAARYTGRISQRWVTSPLTPIIVTPAEASSIGIVIANKLHETDDISSELSTISADLMVYRIPNSQGRLTGDQKAAIRALCQSYAASTCFRYTYGHSRNDYATHHTVDSTEMANAYEEIEGVGKFKINCNTLVQNIWMGRKLTDYSTKNGEYSASASNTKYSPVIDKAFDWGYLCDFPLRSTIGGLHKTVEVEGQTQVDYYGFTQPTDGSDVGSYSINTYYQSVSSARPHSQAFNSFIASNDLARRLEEIGCEVSPSEMDVGDLVFTAPMGPHQSSDNNFFYDIACWRSISHVMIVMDKTADGRPVFLEAAGVTNGIRVLDPTSDDPETVANWGARIQRIRMVARHPVVVGKQNSFQYASVPVIPMASSIDDTTQE